MFKIRIAGTEQINPYEELVKVFLPPAAYELSSRQEDAGPENADSPERTYVFRGDRDALKRQLYHDLADYTGKDPKWGILTGIRPVKLAGELALAAHTKPDINAARRVLQDRYLLHPDKAALVCDILAYQQETAGTPGANSLSLYLGIPFCPTRCLYCSFTSNQVGEEEIARYLTALSQEIAYAGQQVSREGWQVESVYIGGGTPTTLQAPQLSSLLMQVREAFDLSACREFTVEAGRPDTFTPQKLEALRAAGIDRISINPQSMKQETLDLIGRRHTAAQTRDAFALAKAAGFPCINTDLIAGLPEEGTEDFTDSLAQILDLGADNITLHTLAVKRASRLKEMDEEFHYKREAVAEEMLSQARGMLRQAGYRPYYLYRQKHTSGNTENIGYCREDKVSIYNIRIMEEHQSILALGAGGISKIYFPQENRLERVANVSNYEIYIDRIDEMINRKASGFFGQTR